MRSFKLGTQSHFETLKMPKVLADSLVSGGFIMYSESDIVSVYNFLKDTPEGPLKKMLVGGEMTDPHLRMLLKMVRGCSEGEFVEAFNAESIPKVRLNPNEYPMKETIWPICKRKLQSVGLLGAEVKQAA